MVFCLIQLLLFRLWKSLCRWIEFPLFVDRPCNRLVICLLRHSIFLLGTILFLYVCMHADIFQTKAPIIKVIFHLLIVWILTKWCMDAAKLYAAGNQQIPAGIINYFHLLIIIVRCFAAAYILFSWLLPYKNTVFILWRLCFECAPCVMFCF